MRPARSGKDGAGTPRISSRGPAPCLDESCNSPFDPWQVQAQGPPLTHAQTPDPPKLPDNRVCSFKLLNVWGFVTQQQKTNEHDFFQLLLPPSFPILNISGTSSVITHDAETNPRADALSVLCNANAGGMWPGRGCRSPASVGGLRAAQGFILSDSHKTNFSL